MRVPGPVAPAVSPVPLTWRLLRDAPLPGARNMALDHALAACLGEGEGVLRLYGWARPTVSVGRNEPARGLYGDLPGVDLVRRPTGGRAVVHWRELTYAVVAPLNAWGGLRAAYVAINEGLAWALAALGVPAEVAGGAVPAGATRVAGARDAAVPALRPDAGPCFQSPAPGEVVAVGRKLVGSAQARLAGSLLQHGSILLHDDQAMLERLAGGGVGAAGDRGGARPATLSELVGDVSIDELAELVAMSLRETFGGSWAPGGYQPREIETAARLEAERYARDSWTWRR
ncbi:MAG TPA: biotin/lipoate A/B protein ligase family protein [Longimicrobiales bacterium]|nr:biotin/lipoate A/B protein ligase family protein [Longimicrobiales bacterium]